MGVNDSVNTIKDNQDSNANIISISLANVNIGEGAGGFPKLTKKEAPHLLQEEVKGTDVGAALHILDINGDAIRSTNKFFLQGFSFNTREKTQVVETFEGSSLSFFGEAVKMYSFQGVAVDHGASGIVGGASGASGFHLSALVKLYNDEMRATKLVNNNNIAVMTIMNHTIKGYPVNFSTGYSSAQDKIGTFSMQWVVTDHSLSLQGVVTEGNLEELTKPLANSEALQLAIKEMDEVLTSINNVIMLKNYKGFEDSLSTFEVFDKTMFTDVFNDAIVTNIKASIKENLNALKPVMKHGIKSSYGLLGPIIQLGIGTAESAVEDYFAVLINDIDRFDFDSDAGIASLTAFKGNLGRLLTVRSKLINMMARVL